MSQESKNSSPIGNPSPPDSTKPNSNDNGIKTINPTNDRSVRKYPEKDIYKPDKARPLKPRQNDRPNSNDQYTDSRNINRFNSLNPVRPSTNSNSGADFRNPSSYNFKGGSDASTNRIHNGPILNSNTRYNPNKNNMTNSSINRVHTSNVDGGREMHSHQHHQSQHQNSYRNDRMQPIEEHNMSLGQSKSRIFNLRSHSQAPHTIEMRDHHSHSNNTSTLHRTFNHENEKKAQLSHPTEAPKTSRGWARPDDVLYHQHGHESTVYQSTKPISTIGHNSSARELSNDNRNEAQSRMAKPNPEHQSIAPKAHSPHDRSNTPNEESERSNQSNEQKLQSEPIPKQLDQSRTLRSGRVLGPENSCFYQKNENLVISNKPIETACPPENMPLTNQTTSLDDPSRNLHRTRKLSGDRENESWRRNPSDEQDIRQQQRDTSFSRRSMGNQNAGRNYQREKHQVPPRFRNSHFVRQNNDTQIKRPLHSGSQVEQYSDGYTNERQPLNNGGVANNVYGHKPNVANNQASNCQNLTHQIKDNMYPPSRSSSVGSNDHYKKQSIEMRDLAQEPKTIHTNSACDLNIDDVLKEINNLQNIFSNYFTIHGSRDVSTVASASINLLMFTENESAYNKLFELPTNHFGIKAVQLENLWNRVHFRLIKLTKERYELTSATGFKNNLLEYIDHVIIYYDDLIVKLFQRFKVTTEDITSHRHKENDGSVLGSEIPFRDIIHIYQCLGDVWGIKEQMIKTDTVRSRAYYFKALLIDPTIDVIYRKLGSSFQSSKRNIDSLYFHMRYYASPDKLHESENFCQLVRSISQDGERDTKDVPDDQQLDELDLMNLNKLFNSSFIDIHSKLLNKETYPPAKTINQMLLQFRCLLKKSPTPFSSQRLLQLMSMNMFAALYCSSQEIITNEVLAMELTFTMISMIIEASNNCLYNHIQSEGFLGSSLPRDLHEFLPAVNLWKDWISCHDRVNLSDQILSSEIGLSNTKPGHWPEYLADLYNLLDVFDVDISKFCDTRNKNMSPVWLLEEIHFIGFAPLDNLPKNKFYCEASNLNERNRNHLRIHKIRSFIRNLSDDSKHNGKLFKLDDATGKLRPIINLCEEHPSVGGSVIRSDTAIFDSIRKRVLDNKSEINAQTDAVDSSSSPPEQEEESSWVRIEMEAKARDEALSRPAIQNKC